MELIESGITDEEQQIVADAILRPEYDSWR